MTTQSAGQVVTGSSSLPPAFGRPTGVQEVTRMTIYVGIDAQGGQRTGDWVVRNGAGGTILSRHRTKAAAKSRGKQEARKRNTDLKIQNSGGGTWKQGPSY